jgi:hypothetical protein
MVYGFTLDSNSAWYVTDNYMVTHNSGKSTFVQAVCNYLDNDLDVKNIVFSGDELMQRIIDCKRGQAIIYDEAITNMSASDFATKIQQILINTFTMIRSKGLYICLIIPNPFMLRRYFYIFRTKFLLHSYCPDGVTRGFFKFYSYNRKKQMYLRGFKEWDMNCVAPNFRGRFTDTTGFFVHNDEYEAKKQDAIRKMTEQTEKDGKKKLEEQFKDKVLLMNINNKKWQLKVKEKYDAKIAELKQKAMDKLHSKKIEINELKSDEGNKERVKELEREYSCLLYGYWETMNHYQKKYQGIELEKGVFFKLLAEKRYIKLPEKQVNKFYESGKQYAQLVS